MSNNDDWREMRRDANRAGRFGLAWIAVIIVAALAIGGAIWGISVAVAPIKGQGDAAIKKYSAENWTQAQAAFEQAYADIQAQPAKIQIAQQAYDANPDDLVAQKNLQGLQSYCISRVADYNAKSRSYLLEDFKAADLPQTIDDSLCTPSPIPTPSAS